MSTLPSSRRERTASLVGANDERVDRRRILPVGLAAIAITVVANVLVRAVGQAIFEIDDAFDPLATVFPTVMASVVYMLLAVGVFAVLVRYVARPLRFFRLVAVVALVLSYLPLLAQWSAEGASAGAITTLGAMHLVGFAAAVGLLTTRTRAAA